MIVGILALQGDFYEHQEMLKSLGVATRQVRLPQHLDQIDRLIIPGGESTTIGKLLVSSGLLEPVRACARQGVPLWGTCAGAILLAQHIVDSVAAPPNLGLMDIRVRRNAYGRQIDSFETMLHLPGLGAAPLRGVFIRAPVIEAVGPDVEPLGRLPAPQAGASERPGRAAPPPEPAEAIVAARQGRMLVTTFHPELSGDARMHRYFLDL